MLHQLTASLGFAPLVPVWLLALLGLLALGLCLYACVYRTKGAVLRLGACAALLLWLAGPQRLHESWRMLPETALLVVDQSPSMSVGKRAEIAQQAAQVLTQSTVQGLNLRTVTVRNTEHDGTRLFNALDQAAADIPPDQFAGAIMLTDGQVADTPATLPERLTPIAANGGKTPLPLHVLLPAKGEETDRRIRILQSPPYALVGQQATLKVQVDDAGPGTHAGTPATLTVRVNGEDPLEIPVTTGTPQTLSLPVTHPGQILVSMVVSALPGEVSDINNRTLTRMNGIRDKLRVLLISGTPNQGERVWRRLLKADPSVDLIHFTILRPPEKDDGTPISDLALIPFPIRELFQDKINQFDLIILDGFENQNILPYSYLRNVANFVRKGGGLLLTAGPEFVGTGSLQDTPVGEILPAHVVKESGLITQAFRPHLTQEGRAHPVTASLPGAPPATGATHTQPGSSIEGQWGPWYRALRSDSTHGQTLLSGPEDSPLLVLDHVEKGRVALLLSDQIWLWSRGEGGGGPQAELLRRISHWLMKEPELEEEQLSATLSGTNLTVTRRSASQTPVPSVQVTAPNGTRAPLPLHAAVSEGNAPSTQPINGLSTGHMMAEQAGIWQVDDGTHKAFAAPPAPDPQEFADLRATATTLQNLTTQSGGGIFWLGDTGSAPPKIRFTDDSHSYGQNWIAFPHRHAHVVTGRSATPLLPTWLVMVCALVLLFAGWWREGRA